MPKLTIDGQEVEVPPGSTILQACEAAGREVPVFCFHPRLNIAGNCRMCLVEVAKMPKPQASCALPVAEGMVVSTNTPAVHKARRGVLELLLINHPLDCPICDQGGECDLQDLTLFYGPDHSRFAENKRPVPDKDLGPLVSTHMTRCIHCTRCIRFFTEVAGVEELGAVNRGEHMEITTWVERALGSEISGNVIDLCPVGALNSKPYEYRARTWELRKTKSIDVTDAVGCNIRIDARGSEVMRILPRLNEDVNEEWISDKARFCVDGLRRRRLDVPMVKQGGTLQPTGWNEAFTAIRTRLAGVAPEKVAFVVGDLVDCETMVLVRELASRLGTPHVDCRQDGAKLDAARRAGYLFNSTIAGIDKADACLLVGTNPRWEAPIINTRLRKRWRGGGLKVGRIGAVHPLTYPVEELGAGPETLAALARGELAFAEVLRQAKNPMLILGMGALARPDGAAVMSLAASLAQELGLIKDDWNGFNVLHTAAARVGGLDLGLVPGQGGRDVAGILDGAQSGEIEVVFLIGADELDTSRPRRRVRGLSGPSRRSGRPGGGRDPARCRLHREERQLGQYRGTPAARQAGGVPAGRGQGGLEDPAGAVGGAGPQGAAGHAGPGPRPDGRARRSPECHRPGRAGGMGRGRGVGPARSAGLRLADRRFLPDRPDQPGVDGDGRVQPAVRARRRAGGDRHPWLRRSTAPSGR